MKLKYKSGYKYQLVEDYVLDTGWKVISSIETKYISLDVEGVLIVKEGYAWDGPSGPTIDTKNFMRGSLVHDALYQLIREGHLVEGYRKFADRLLYAIIREDGMNWIRAKFVYYAVRLFGKPAADPSNDKQLIEAP